MLAASQMQSVFSAIAMSSLLGCYERPPSIVKGGQLMIALGSAERGDLKMSQ